MEYALGGWTFFWFFIPMPLLFLWAVITFFTERGGEE